LRVTTEALFAIACCHSPLFTVACRHLSSDVTPLLLAPVARQGFNYLLLCCLFLTCRHVIAALNGNFVTMAAG